MNANVRSGLDAVTYLQFLRLLRWLFTCIAVLVALPLTCANYYINTRTDWGSTDSDKPAPHKERAVPTESTGLLSNMQLLTAANIKGNGLYAHIGFGMIISLLVVFFGKQAGRSGSQAS